MAIARSDVLQNPILTKQANFLPNKQISAPVIRKRFPLLQSAQDPLGRQDKCPKSGGSMEINGEC